MPAANSKKSAAAVTPVAFKKKIGSCLRDCRKAADFTQYERAAEIGIRHYQISRYERGRDAPTLYIITQIADACEVPALEILQEILA